MKEIQNTWKVALSGETFWKVAFSGETFWKVAFSGETFFRTVNISFQTELKSNFTENGIIQYLGIHNIMKNPAEDPLFPYLHCTVGNRCE